MLRIEKPDGFHTFRHEAMATEFSISLGEIDAQYARQAVHETSQLLDDLESKLSLYQENSDVTRINRSRKGEVVTVSEECMACLCLALEASAATEGRFNALLGREACRAKGFLPSFLKASGGQPEDAEEKGSAIAIDPGSRRVERLHENGLLDLGGIGKGFALDRLLEVLEDWEVPRILLNSGGSTLLFRAEEGSDPWTGHIGERRMAPFSNGALASSGLGFQERHIVEPGSGASRCLWTRSYARCASAAMADAFSTAVMLMEWPMIESVQRARDDLSIAVQGDQELRICGSF